MKRSIFAAILMMSTAWAIVPAQAQVDVDRGRNIAVMDRPRPEYDAVGLNLGAFDVFPSVTLTAEHNDNVFAAGKGQPKDSDLIFSVQPYVAAHSTWGRHALNANIGAASFAHQDFDSLDYTDVYGSVDGRIDVLRDVAITAGVGAAERHEPRTAAEASGGATELVSYTDHNGFVGASATLNRVRLSARLEERQLDYEDVADPTAIGGVADQDFRDHNERVATLRAEYALSPDTALVAQVGLNDREYDLQPPHPDQPIDRDSQGREFLVGVNTDISKLIRGEIVVGQTQQEYEAASIGTIEGLAVRAKAQWFPTEMTTVSFRAEREVVDTGVFGSAGALTTREGVRVDHELMRNVILTGGIDAAQADYQTIDRKDKWIDGDVGVIYLMNRNVGVNARYYRTDIDSSGAAAGRDIEVNRFVLGLTLKM